MSEEDDEAVLDACELVRDDQTRNSSKQWLHERESDGARGLKFTSWSSGTSCDECASQKMLPHLRQWCRRVK